MLKLEIDTSRFDRAFAAFTRNSKKSHQVVLFDQARNFVRRVIALTPPSQGKADSTAKARGEAAIAGDLGRIFSPGSADFMERFIQFHGGRTAQDDFAHRGAASLGFIYTRALEKNELTSWHQSRRTANGRVGRIGNGQGLNRQSAAQLTTGLRRRDLHLLDIGLVETRTYEWFKKRVQKRVGLLAAGWNTAAERLGYRPPAWIRRHGTDRGGVEITLGNGVFRIRISNDLSFASAVKGFPARVQKALDEQAAAMERKVRFYEERVARAAGLKVT